MFTKPRAACDIDLEPCDTDHIEWEDAYEL